MNASVRTLLPNEAPVADPCAPGEQPRHRRGVLSAARRRAEGWFLGELRASCPQPACPAREVLIRIVEQAGVGSTPSQLRCPVCGRRLVLHAALTRDEADAEERRAARALARLEAYQAQERRRLGDPGALVGVPIWVLMDDRALPESGLAR